MFSLTFLDTDLEKAPDTERSPGLLPSVVDGIEPVEPTPALPSPGAGSWESFVRSLYLQSTQPITPPCYKVEFVANDEYVSLVDRARELLCRTLPEAGLEELQLRAMRAYVAELEGRYTSRCAAM